MKFFIFNMKKDRKIIIKNSIFLSIILVLSLQIYGVYWFNYEYKVDNRLENGVIYSIAKDLSLEELKNLESVKNLKYFFINHKLENDKISARSVDLAKINEIFHMETTARTLIKSKQPSKPYLGEYVDYSDKENLVTIPFHIFEYYKYEIGDIITINNKNFIIKGVSGSETGPSFIFSILGAKRIGLNDSNIHFVLNEGLGNKERQELVNDISRILSKENFNIQFPNLEEDGSNKIFNLLFIILALSIFNIILVYNYFLDKRKIRRSIFRIEGLNNKRMFFYSILEVVIIFLLAMIISFIIVEIFNKIIMKQLLNVNRYSLPFTNYLLLFGIYFIIYFILIVINNRKLLKENILLK